MHGAQLRAADGDTLRWRFVIARREAAQSVVGAHPDTAVRRHLDADDQTLIGELTDSTRCQAVEAFGRARPDVAILVFEQRADPVAEQPGQRARPLCLVPLGRRGLIRQSPWPIVPTHRFWRRSTSSR